MERGKQTGQDTLHWLSNFAIRSTFFSSKSANLSIIAPLFAPAVAFHPGRAALAAATALSTSASDATWTLSDTTESSLGLYIVKVSPVLDLTYFLAYQRICQGAVGVAYLAIDEQILFE